MARMSITFNDNSDKDRQVYEHLSKLGRKKGKYISEIIYQHLPKNNVKQITLNFDKFDDKSLMAAMKLELLGEHAEQFLGEVLTELSLNSIQEYIQAYEAEEGTAPVHPVKVRIGPRNSPHPSRNNSEVQIGPPNSFNTSADKGEVQIGPQVQGKVKSQESSSDDVDKMIEQKSSELSHNPDMLKGLQVFLGRT